jgi:pimeloyl-ACP methyl ester carboxylesterase
VLCGAGLALGTSDEAVETMRAVTLGKAPRPFDPKRVCPDGGREMMQKAYMEGIKTDPRATLVDLEASQAYSKAFDPQGITCPATIVSGAAENVDCVARAKALAGELSSGRTDTVEAAAHFLPLEQPAALAAVIKAEIKRIAEAA